jgi:hypothetical protein
MSRPVFVVALMLLAVAAVAVFVVAPPRSSPGLPAPAEPGLVTVYKTPWCGCCSDWVDHLRAEGLPLRVIEQEDLRPTRAALGVPEDLASCHTAEVAGYALEGHVPAREIRRLLEERPAIVGIAVPGMPIGSPGMEVEGWAGEAYDVVTFGDGPRGVFASYPQAE